MAKVANRNVVDYALSNKNVEGYGAVSTTDYPYGVGSLPYRLSNVFYGNRKKIKRVIYSYVTPIAWLTTDDQGNDVWVVPSVSYSVTTSKHQGYLWKLPNRVSVPWDVSPEEYDRVLNHKMYFGDNATFPGKNWTLD